MSLISVWETTFLFQCLTTNTHIYHIRFCFDTDPDARMNARSAPTGRSAPTSVTVRTGPSATTSTGPVCVTRALRAPAARTGSVPPACTDSSVTNTAPAKLQTHSGALTLYNTVRTEEGCVSIPETVDVFVLQCQAVFVRIFSQHVCTSSVIIHETFIWDLKGWVQHVSELLKCLVQEIQSSSPPSTLM